jgi:uncharacterized protein YggT (Ycf19 family)
MRVIGTLIELYSLVVLGAVIMSWLPIGQRNGLVVILQRLTEPALAPIVGSCHRWAVSICRRWCCWSYFKS